MAQVTIRMPNGQTATVNEVTPGLLGQLGYTYVSGGPTTPAPAPAPSQTPVGNTVQPTVQPSYTAPAPTPQEENKPKVPSGFLERWTSGAAYEIFKSFGEGVLRQLPNYDKIEAIRRQPGFIYLPDSEKERIVSALAKGEQVNLPAGITLTSTLLTTPTTEVKGKFQESSYYKSLSSDLRSLVDLAFSSVTGTPEQQQSFNNALTQAQALADPYAKTQLALAKSEVATSIAETNSNYKAKQEILTRTRDEILADIVSSKEYLTLAQQAEMAKEASTYNEDVLSIADQSAEKGLTFATGARSRQLAETRRSEQYSNVIQSSQRDYNFKIKELELKATRGDVDAKRQLDNLQTQKGFDLQKIGRNAEEVLGTANLPTVEGYNPVGGSLGSIEQERRKSIIDLAKLSL